MNRLTGLRAADESTEILLTDYLDGRLDPRRQAELDAYLAQHPDQRAVLADLMEHRSRLQALPAETAPRELLLDVNARLERSALLDGADTLETPRRSRRLPQLAAMAAVLTLTAGLAVTTWWVLAPRPHATPPLATSSQAGPAAMAARDDVAAGRAAALPRSSEGTLAAAGPRWSAEPSTALPERSAPLPAGEDVAAVPPAAALAAPAETAGSAAAPGSPGATAARASAEGPADLPAGMGGPFARMDLADELAGYIGPVDRTVVLSSPDPVATRARVETFLREGGWACSPAPSDLVPGVPLWAVPWAGPAAAVPGVDAAMLVRGALLVRVEAELLDTVVSALRSKADAEALRSAAATPLSPTHNPGRPDAGIDTPAPTPHARPNAATVQDDGQRADRPVPEARTANPLPSTRPTRARYVLVLFR
ncbi:MAG: hypothetical protein ACK4PI_10960 [Tepidisphaerales bacterium]